MPFKTVAGRIAIVAVVALLSLFLLVQGAALLLLRGHSESRIRDALTKEIGKATGCRVEIGDLRAALFGRIVATDLRISHNGRELVSADEAVVSYSLLRFFTGGFDPLAMLSRIEFVKPRVSARLLEDGRLDLVEILAGRGGSGSETALRATIAVRDGLVSVAGLPNVDSGRVSELNGYVSFRRYPALQIAARGRLQQPAGLRFSVSGTADVRTGDVDGRVEVGGVQLDQWNRLGLVPEKYGRVSGRVDAEMRVSLSDGKASLNGGQLTWQQGRYVYPAAGITVTGIRARASLEAGGVRVHSLKASWQGSSISLSGYAETGPKQRVDLKVSARKVDLAAVAAAFPGAGELQLAGRADVSARVRGSADSPVATARVELARGRVYGQEVGRVKLDADYRNKRLDVRLRSEVMAGLAEGWAVWYPLARDPQLTAEVRLKSIDMSRAITLAPWKVPVAGSLSGRLLVRSTAADPWRAYGTVEAADGRVAGQPFDSAGAAFSFTNGSFALESLAVRHGRGILTATGKIGADGALQLKGSALQLELKNALDAAGFPGSGMAEASFTVGGTLSEPVGAAALTVAGASVQGTPIGTLQADVALEGKRLRFSRVRVSHPEHRISAEGAVDLVDGSLDARIDAADIRLGLILEAAGAKNAFPVTGSVNAALNVSGKISDPRVQGDVRSSRIQLGLESIDEVEAAVDWDGQRLNVSPMTVRKGSSVAHVNGTLDLKGRLSGTVTLTGLPLETIETLKGVSRGLVGAVSLTGNLSGTVKAPEFTAALSGSGLELSGFRLGEVSGNVSWSNNRLALSGFRLKQDAKSYILQGWVDPVNGTTDVKLVCDNGQIAELVGLAGLKTSKPVDGTITGSLELRGDLQKPAGRLAVEIENAAVAGASFNATVDAGFTVQLGSEVRLADLTLNRVRLWHGDGSMLATGRYNSADGTDVTVIAKGFDISPIAALIGGPVTLSGTADANVRLVDYPSNPRLSGNVTLINGRLAGADFERFQAVASADGDGVLLSRAQVERKGDSLLAEGFIPFNAAIRKSLGITRAAGDRPETLDLNVTSGSFALDWLPSVVGPALKSTRGRLSLQAHVGGTPAEPDMQGTFALTKGSVEVAGLERAFTGIDGRGHFDGDRVVFESFQAGYGSGRLTAGGTLTLDFFAVERYDLWAKAEKLIYDSHPFAGTLRGNLRYQGPGDAPVLGGEVWISEARISAPLGDDSNGGSGGPLPNIGLDLTVHVGSDVRLKQGLTIADLDVPVEGTLHVGGSLIAPKLSGQITANRGSISAYRNDFQVLEAHAEFAESRGVLPFIRVSASKPVQGAVVFVRLEGEVGSDLKLEFDSNPAMSNQEILTLLDIPGMLRDNGMNAQNLLDEGIYVVGKAVFDTIGRNVAQWLSVDEFSLVPRGASWFSSGLELRVGKFITPQFYLGYSSFYEDTLVHNLSVNYYTTPWSVFNFSFSTIGDFNVGYSLRLRF